MSVTLEVSPEQVEAELFRQANFRGTDPNRYAAEVVRELRETGSKAAGITDDEAKQLLLVSALENALPGLLSSTSRTDTQGLLFLLFAVIGLIYVAQKPSEEDIHNAELWKLLKDAGHDATREARSNLHAKGIGFAYLQNEVVVEELPDGTVRALTAVR